MNHIFDDEYNEMIKSLNDSLFFFSENSFREEDNEPYFHNDCNKDELQKTSPNNIESNQNLSQKKTSDISQEKKNENIKNDEKPYIEISKTNNNKNLNSDTEKEKPISNANDKIDNKEKTQEKKEPDYRFENFMKKIKTFVFKSIFRYVNSLIKGRKKLKKIVNNVSRNIDSKYNKELLNKNLEDIISMDISKKYKIKNKKYNKETIAKIYEENNQNVIKILNMELKDFINKFKENPTLKGYYDSYIDKMKKEYSDNYVGTFESYFDRFCEICEKRKEKKEKKRKKSEKEEK
jgi:hypothetical protein